MKYPEELNRMLIQRIPSLAKSYEENVAWQEGDETGAHVVYGDVFVPAIISAIRARNRRELSEYSEFIEDVLGLNNDEAENVIAVSVIESLWDLDGPDRAIAFDILGPKGREVWLDIERYFIDNAELIREWNAAQPPKKLPWE